MRTRIRLVTCLAAIGFCFATATHAAQTSSSGGPLIRTYVKSDDIARIMSSTTLTNLATLRVLLPAGTRDKLIVARFSAESQCYGSAAGWCIVKIIARKVGTAIDIPLNPNAGVNFAFDSNNTGAPDIDLWESHSMERWIRVEPGTYDVIVQWSVTAATTNIFYIDDWTLRVDVLQ